MTTYISRLTIIALLCLQAWAAQAHGGDGHRSEIRRASHDELFTLGGQGTGGQRGDDLFRLDGGRTKQNDPFRLGGQRSEDRRDGRRHDGPKDDGRRDGKHFRTDDRPGGGSDFMRVDTQGGYDRPDARKRVRDQDRDGDRRRDHRYRDDGRRHVSPSYIRQSPRGDFRRPGNDDGPRHDSGRYARHEVRHIVHYLPPRHAVILHGRDRYHYHGGRFYRPWNAGFILVRPPLGLIVLSLPLGSHTIISAGITYHVFGDVYYRRVPAGYEVVEPIRAPGRKWPARVAVVTDTLNLRYGPEESEEIIAQAGRYTILNVIGSAPGWLYVEIDGEDVRGWVMERYVTTDLARG